MKKTHKLVISTTSYLLLLLLTGCGDASLPSPPPPLSSGITVSPATPSSAPGEKLVFRDNTPVCLVPLADGTMVANNDVAFIDYSRSEDGYVCIKYTGKCQKVKMRITGPDKVVYTYELHGSDYESFPLSAGDGIYEIGIYENISGTNYSTCLFKKIPVTLADEFSTFLYPNQYVSFREDSDIVSLAAELSKNATCDMDVITRIYDYIIGNITYDHEKASDPPTDYTTDVDAILHSGTGICIDYAAVMAGMLRSQRIPTRLDIGYAQDAYHAWISVYTKEQGWLNDIIAFDGSVWTLVDPTFGANNSTKTLKKFIGDGTNYTLQKMY